LSGPHAWKPIHAATYNEFKKMTELLTERGANLSAQCKVLKNYSPLHILISTDKPPVDLVELLIKKKAPLDIQHESGGTPLHLAAFWGHLDVTKVLLNAGAKMDIKNEKGRTALDIAALYGHREVAETIAKKSGQPVPKLKEKKKKTTSMKAPVEPPNPEKKN
jgi:ankyrin repeat protein